MMFSADGSLLILNIYPGIQFWDVAEGKIIHTIEYSPEDMKLSNDGKLLITIALDGTVRLWGIP